MISLVIRITFIFALLPTFIEARRHRRRFGLKLKKTDNSNDVVIKTQYDQCSQFCRPNPKQFVKIINEQWVISITFQCFSIYGNLDLLMLEHANRVLKNLSLPLVYSSFHKQPHQSIIQISILVNQSHGWTKNTGLVINSTRFRSLPNVDVENKKKINSQIVDL